MTQQDESKLAAARAMVYMAAPYFTNALWRCHAVWDDSMPWAIAVDRRARIWINATDERFKTWSAAELGAEIVLQLNRVLRRHHERYENLVKTKNPLAWDVSTECEICDRFEYGRLALPQDTFTPDGLGLDNDMLAEQYYELLDDSEKLNTADPASAQESYNAQSQDNDEQGAGAGDDDAPQGLSELEQDMLRQAVAQDIQKHRGNLPGGLRQWAEAELAPSQTPWQHLLESSIRLMVATIRGNKDYSFSRPNRRGNAGGLILPAMVSPKQTIEIVVVLDVSGSMSLNTDIAASLRELNAILKISGANVRYLSCDTVPTSAQRIFKADRLEIVGRAGTDMREGIRAAEELVPAPDVIVVFTDGYTPWPDERPRARVIIALAGREPDDTIPSWATLVKIDTAT